MTLKKRQLLLDELTNTVSNIINSYQSYSNYTFEIDSKRTAKDILEHIVFWHESFSRNTHDLAHKIKPNPLKGSYAKLSEQCKKEMSNIDIKKLLNRLEKSQKIIEDNILFNELTVIPYRIGSRDYTPEEHLDIVNQHLQEHLNEVNNSYNYQE